MCLYLFISDFVTFFLKDFDFPENYSLKSEITGIGKLLYVSGH